MVASMSARVRGEEAWIVPEDQSLAAAEVMDRIGRS
jgi:hypothetical protein